MIVIRTVLDSWWTLFSFRTRLVGLWHQQLADSLNLTLSEPLDLDRSREELFARLSARRKISFAYFLALERQSTATTRAISLWNIVWFNLLPGVLVLPLAVQRIPQAFHGRPGVTGAALLTVFAAFAFLICCYVGLFVQSQLLPTYTQLVNWLTQPRIDE